MKKRILHCLLLVYLCFTSVLLYSQNKVPVQVNYSTVVLMDEFDMHLYQAAQLFINFNDSQSCEEIRKASFFIGMQAYNLKSDNKEKLLVLEKKLLNLADDVENGKISNIQQLAKSFAESHLILSKFYIGLANEFYLNNNSINCVFFLDAAGSYLMLGAKWAGYEVAQGTRSTRKSIAHLVGAVNTRNEINNDELKNVLDFISKEIKKFNAFLAK